MLRGLIPSDGCRVTNRVGGGVRLYSVPFSNTSVDILRIFRERATRSESSSETRGRI